jgi:SAM-dependent methyltransferase
MAPFDATARGDFPKSLASCSPKLTVSEKRAALYPYYAGYSEAFVAAAFDVIGLECGARVLDPWNGGGTTTLVAAERGAASTGLDLNPVLSSIARARTAGARAVGSAERAVEAVLERHAAGGAAGAASLSEMRLQTHAALESATAPLQAKALVDVMFFRTARRLTDAHRTSNPTWFKSPNSITVAGAILDELKHQAAAVLEKQRTRRKRIHIAPRIYTADFAEWRGLRHQSYDFVVTSPPYLTRIDYAMATYAELQLVLGHSQKDIVDIRKRMLGSPLTVRVKADPPNLTSVAAINLLKAIHSHPSKASKAYYHRFFCQYLMGLELSASRVARALRRGGKAVFVVQSSRYKEHLVDLAEILAQSASAAGLKQIDRVDFPQTRSMVTLNRRAIGYSGTLSLSESALIFEKVSA